MCTLYSGKRLFKNTSVSPKILIFCWAVAQPKLNPRFCLINFEICKAASPVPHAAREIERRLDPAAAVPCC